MSNMAGKMLSIIVKHSVLGASGGSYLVRYAADIELRTKTDIDVVIVGVYPNDPAPDDVEAARNAIHRGAHKCYYPSALMPVSHSAISQSIQWILSRNSSCAGLPSNCSASWLRSLKMMPRTARRPDPVDQDHSASDPVGNALRDQVWSRLGTGSGVREAMK